MKINKASLMIGISVLVFTGCLFSTFIVVENLAGGSDVVDHRSKVEPKASADLNKLEAPNYEYLKDEVGMNTPANTGDLSVYDIKNIAEFMSLVSVVGSGGKVDLYAMDAVTKKIMFSEHMSRVQKVSVLIGAIKESEGGFQHYLIDVMSSMYPFEATDDLIDIFHSSDSEMIRAQIMGVLKDVQLATTLGQQQFNEETYEIYKGKIDNVERFYREVIYSGDKEMSSLAFSYAPSILDHAEVEKMLLSRGGIANEVTNTELASVYAQVAISGSAGIDEKLATLSQYIRSSSLETQDKNSLNYVLSQVTNHYSENLQYASLEARNGLMDSFKHIEPSVTDAGSINDVIEYRNWITSFINVSFDGKMSFDSHIENILSNVSDPIKKEIIVNDFMPM